MPTSTQTHETRPGISVERRSRTAPGRRSADRRLSNGSLALLQALQSSLEPGVVVDTFARRLGEQLGVEGLAFDHPEHGRYWGAQAKYPYATPLQLDGAPLGRLEFYRQRAFAPSERRELGVLTELLLHPLRNALTHATLQKQAFEDGLTGLLNRKALDRMLPRELASAERHGQPLTLVMLDMDRLKPINDKLGHAAGDRALQVMAGAIVGALRQSDLGFRIGGDEFVLLLPLTPAAGACTVVERIRRAVADNSGPLQCSGTRGQRSPQVTFSAGIATSAPGIAPDALLHEADQAMYRAKQARQPRRRPRQARPAPPPAPDFAAERAAGKLSRR